MVFMLANTAINIMWISAMPAGTSCGQAKQARLLRSMEPWTRSSGTDLDPTEFLDQEGEPNATAV